MPELRPHTHTDARTALGPHSSAGPGLGRRSTRGGPNTDWILTNIVHGREAHSARDAACCHPGTLHLPDPRALVWGQAVGSGWRSRGWHTSRRATGAGQVS